MRHTYLKHKSNWIKEQINLCMCSLTIQHSSGWRMSSRSEEAILRQTSCVMFVCVFVCVCMVTQLQAELGILNYHISTSREKPKGYTHMPVRKHTCMCIYTHTLTHTPPPHISGTAGPLLRSSNTPIEGGGCWWWCWGGRGEGCWVVEKHEAGEWHWDQG